MDLQGSFQKFQPEGIITNVINIIHFSLCFAHYMLISYKVLLAIKPGFIIINKIMNSLNTNILFMGVYVIIRV